MSFHGAQGSEWFQATRAGRAAFWIEGFLTIVIAIRWMTVHGPYLSKSLIIDTKIQYNKLLKNVAILHFSFHN